MSEEKRRVAIIGHIDTGKASLTAAIVHVLASSAMIDNKVAPRHYAHVDCPAHDDYVKGLVTGASPMDIPIVVSAADGHIPKRAPPKPT